MTARTHAPDRYEFRISKSKLDGSIREVVVTFDFPLGYEPEGKVDSVAVGLDGLIRLQFGADLAVVLPDTDDRMIFAIGNAAKVSIVYSFADGTVRGTEILRVADAA